MPQVKASRPGQRRGVRRAPPVTRVTQKGSRRSKGDSSAVAEGDIDSYMPRHKSQANPLIDYPALGANETFSKLPKESWKSYRGYADKSGQSRTESNASSGYSTGLQQINMGYNQVETQMSEQQEQSRFSAENEWVASDDSDTAYGTSSNPSILSRRLSKQSTADTSLASSHASQWPSSKNGQQTHNAPALGPEYFQSTDSLTPTTGTHFDRANYPGTSIARTSVDAVGRQHWYKVPLSDSQYYRLLTCALSETSL